MFFFRNFIFKLREWEPKISKLVIKESKERQVMLKKSYLLSRYKTKGGKKKKKKMFDACWPWTRVFPLSHWTSTNTPLWQFFFSKLYLLDSIFTSYIFGLRGCMILMKEYVSLTYFDGNASIKTRACLHGHTLGILRVCLP